MSEDGRWEVPPGITLAGAPVVEGQMGTQGKDMLGEEEDHLPHQVED